MNGVVLLTPGFSPVVAGEEGQNRFNGFSHASKPLKWLDHRSTIFTRLKPGVNENRRLVAGFTIFRR